MIPPRRSWHELRTAKVRELPFCDVDPRAGRRDRSVLQHARSLELRHGPLRGVPSRDEPRISGSPATLLFCVMAYAMLEEDVQAMEFVGRLRQLAPGYSAGTFINTYPVINPPAVAAIKQGAVGAESCSCIVIPTPPIQRRCRRRWPATGFRRER